MRCGRMLGLRRRRPAWKRQHERLHGSCSGDGFDRRGAVATGDVHSCALLGDGSVKCWGSNIYGQLGDGTKTNRSTPVTVNGIANAIAIRNLGRRWSRLRCSRESHRPLLGLEQQRAVGERHPHRLHEPSPGERHYYHVGITAGWSDACALFQWHAKFRPGTTRPAGQRHHDRAVDTGLVEALRRTLDRRWGRRGVSLRSNATVHARARQLRHWARETAGEVVGPRRRDGLNDAFGIADRPTHACALNTEGSAQCWGYASRPARPRSTPTRRFRFAVQGLSGVRAVHAGAWHTCALLKACTRNAGGTTTRAS